MRAGHEPQSRSVHPARTTSVGVARCATSLNFIHCNRGAEQAIGARTLRSPDWTHYDPLRGFIEPRPGKDPTGRHACRAGERDVYLKIAERARGARMNLLCLADDRWLPNVGQARQSLLWQMLAFIRLGLVGRNARLKAKALTDTSRPRVFLRAVRRPLAPAASK